MADRVPILSFPGDLDAWAGSERKIAPALGAGTVSRFVVMVTDSPTGGSVNVELRNASGGGGSALSATIGDGETFATATGSLTTSTGELWVRFASASGQALNLSGWYEVEATVAVTAALTSRDRVKRFMGQTSALGSEAATLVDEIVLAVSTKMQQWMRRRIVQTTLQDVLDATGQTDALVLRHRPVIDGTFTVKTGRPSETQTTLTENTDYEIDLERGILWKLSGAWPRGRRQITVDYDAGFSSVPDDLAHAATKQAVFEARQSKVLGGEERLGRRGTTVAQQGADYITEAWVPGVVETMKRYAAANPPLMFV